MLQTMRSAHTCLLQRSSIGAHEIWRHCDFTRVLTKSQIHVIDRRRCQRAGRPGRLVSKIFSSSYLDVHASIVRAMILREPVHATPIQTRCTNDPSTTRMHAHIYMYLRSETRNAKRVVTLPKKRIFCHFVLRNTGRRVAAAASLTKLI